MEEAKEGHSSYGCQGKGRLRNWTLPQGAKARDRLYYCKPVTEQDALITDTIHLPSDRSSADKSVRILQNLRLSKGALSFPSHSPPLSFHLRQRRGDIRSAIRPCVFAEEEGRKPGLIEDEEKKKEQKKEKEQLLLKAKNQRKEGRSDGGVKRKRTMDRSNERWCATTSSVGG